MKCLFRCVFSLHLQETVFFSLVCRFLSFFFFLPVQTSCRMHVLQVSLPGLWLAFSLLQYCILVRSVLTLMRSSSSSSSGRVRAVSPGECHVALFALCEDVTLRPLPPTAASLVEGGVRLTLALRKITCFLQLPLIVFLLSSSSSVLCCDAPRRVQVSCCGFVRLAGSVTRCLQALKVLGQCFSPDTPSAHSPALSPTPWGPHDKSDTVTITSILYLALSLFFFFFVLQSGHFQQSIF